MPKEFRATSSGFLFLTGLDDEPTMGSSPSRPVRNKLGKPINYADDTNKPTQD